MACPRHSLVKADDRATVMWDDRIFAPRRSRGEACRGPMHGMQESFHEDLDVRQRANEPLEYRGSKYDCCPTIPTSSANVATPPWNLPFSGRKFIRQTTGCGRYYPFKSVSTDQPLRNPTIRSPRRTFLNWCYRPVPAARIDSSASRWNDRVSQKTDEIGWSFHLREVLGARRA